MSVFSQKAAPVIAQLIRDIPQWGRMDAAACLGNLGAESGLEAIQEAHPVSGRGGFGWAQWTGPRRVAFENWCNSHAYSQTSDIANYSFLLQELRTTYAAVVRDVAAAPDLLTKTAAFEHYYEGAGIVRMQARDSFAAVALQSYNASLGVNAQEATKLPGTIVVLPKRTPSPAGAGAAATAAVGVGVVAVSQGTSWVWVVAAVAVILGVIALIHIATAAKAKAAPVIVLPPPAAKLPLPPLPVPTPVASAPNAQQPK
jgi:hypothetical protein